jgi:hypothetical protein
LPASHSAPLIPKSQRREVREETKKLTFNTIKMFGVEKHRDLWKNREILMEKKPCLLTLLGHCHKTTPQQLKTLLVFDDDLAIVRTAKRQNG